MAILSTRPRRCRREIGSIGSGDRVQQTRAGTVRNTNEPIVISLIELVPEMGIEPTTFALRYRGQCRTKMTHAYLSRTNSTATCATYGLEGPWFGMNL
jgi:hypothetical protein